MGLEEPGGRESADSACAREELIRKKPRTRSCLNSALPLIRLPTGDSGNSPPSSRHLVLSGGPSGTPPLIGGEGWEPPPSTSPHCHSQLMGDSRPRGWIDRGTTIVPARGEVGLFVEEPGVGVQTGLGCPCAGSRNLCSCCSRRPGSQPSAGDLWCGPSVLTLPLL